MKAVPMTSWDRRLAAASRFRDADADSLEERLRALGLPDGLHPDDATAITALLRLAEGRPDGFGTTVLARAKDHAGTEHTLRVVILGTEAGGTTLVGDLGGEAVRDTLTGLPGRDYLLKTLGQALQDSISVNRPVALFSIDVDRFKTVNDTQGFRVGDEILRALSAALAEILRPDDVLTRLGGDEFTILRSSVAGTADATALAEQIRNTCVDVAVDNPLHNISVSVGFAIGGPDRSAEDLVREAETALYQAKGLGRDRCELFDDDLKTRSERHNDVDQRLRKALDEDAIEVHYQPIIDLFTDRIVGCEALLRITGEDGSYLNPRELVGAAEDSGLIRRIEETVLNRAATTIRLLPEPDDDPMFVSVNVSERRLLDSRFPLALARTLHNVDLPAEHVHLELNTGVLSQKGAGIRLVTQLRALGVCVVIDEYLGANEAEMIDKDSIDLVKIDKRLVHGIHGERGRARAELVIGSITEQGVDVCAVGVETQEDLEAVRQLGCRYAQGYLFSPPVEAMRLSELIAEQD